MSTITQQLVRQVSRNLKHQWIKCPDCHKWFKTVEQYLKHEGKEDNAIHTHGR